MKTQEEINEEGGRSIAIFMNAVIIDKYADHVLLDFLHKENYPDDSRYHASTMLKYHYSYDWLIPVIQKIVKTIRIKTIDEADEEKWFQDSRIINMRTYISIKTAFGYVTEWIRYYNSNPDKYSK